MFRKILKFIAVLWLAVAYVLIYRSVNYDEYTTEWEGASFWFSETTQHLNLAGYPIFRVCRYRQVLTFQIKAAGTFTMISLPPPLPRILGVLLASVPAIVIAMLPIRRYWRSLFPADGHPVSVSPTIDNPTLQRNHKPASNTTEPLVLEYAAPEAPMALRIPVKWQIMIAVWAAAFLVFIVRQIILTPFD